MKSKDPVPDDSMSDEYVLDYSTAERGKFYRRLVREGSNIVVLEPDVAEVFQDSAAVNNALRALIVAAKPVRRQRRTRRKPA